MGGVIDGSIDVFVIVAGDAADFFAGHHGAGFVVAQLLQPAFVDVLQERVGGAVGRRCRTGAVKADHQAIARNLLAGCRAQKRLKFGTMPPAVESGVADVGVVVGLFAAVFVSGQCFDVTRLPLGCAAGIGTTGDSAVDANMDFLAFHRIHDVAVDKAQKGTAFLNLFDQSLFDGRFDGKFLRGVGNAVELGDAAQELIVGKAGLIMHGGVSLAIGLRLAAAGRHMSRRGKVLFGRGSRGGRGAIQHGAKRGDVGTQFLQRLLRGGMVLDDALSKSNGCLIQCVQTGVGVGGGFVRFRKETFDAAQ